jgi:hypothetical protein
MFKMQQYLINILVIEQAVVLVQYISDNLDILIKINCAQTVPKICQEYRKICKYI